MRKSLGSVGVSKIHPHITVVAPFNSTVEGLIEIENAIWSHLVEVEPFRVTIGAAATFSETSPVLYYSVLDGGSKIEQLASRLQQEVASPKHPRSYIPHVTIADGIAPEVIKSALGLLSKYRAEFDLIGVDLCEKPNETGSSWKIRSRWLFANRLKYVTLGNSRVRIGQRIGVSPSVEAEFKRLGIAVDDLAQHQVTFDPDLGATVSIEAWSEGALLGAVIMRRALNAYAVETLHVDPSVRLMGLGTRLIREAVYCASQAKASELLVWAEENSAGFLQKLGFMPTAGGGVRAELSAEDQNGMMLYLLSLAS